MPARLSSRVGEAILVVVVADNDVREAVLGDLVEECARVEAAQGTRTARWRYWRELFVSAPHLLCGSLTSTAPGGWTHAARAIGAGYAAIVALVVSRDFMVSMAGTRLDPDNWMGATLWLVLDGTAAIAGGYVAAWLRRRAPLASAFGLGLGCLLIGILMIVFDSVTGPFWYHLAVQLIVVPSTLTGGALWMRRDRRLRPPSTGGL